MFQKFINQKVIIRTYTAGVHFGILTDITEDGKGCILSDSKNIWRWEGAAGLSQLSVEGVKVPSETKITMAVPTRLLTEVIEILPLSDAAFTNLNNTAEWKR